LQIYELLGMADAFGGSTDWIKAYETGLASWRAREFARAIGDFEKVLAIRNGDVASSAMIERCKQHLQNPTSDDWDGTTIARTK
jgi:adenylate cyclase